MGNINSITGIVKILEIPKQQTAQKNISVTQVRAQFPQVRNNCVVHLTFWGNLAGYVANYYTINDYILVKGYLSINEEKIPKDSFKRKRKVDITVLKVYPFLLSRDQSEFSTHR